MRFKSQAHPPPFPPPLLALPQALLQLRRDIGELELLLRNQGFHLLLPGHKNIIKRAEPNCSAAPSSSLPSSLFALSSITTSFLPFWALEIPKTYHLSPPCAHLLLTTFLETAHSCFSSLSAPNALLSPALALPAGLPLPQTPSPSHRNLGSLSE